ncbi:hypothetical protein C7N43_08270 [Sphingobacteriales bacterium UPWRP_1]|nr:hypothetical protein B6N25_11205 [Sphingobacteriales bacterium TSM_CSS]PSJ77549.1 hypothetical protein C7N43_08270 [Sphingobacteriales bacterium UPWRP_1]
MYQSLQIMHRKWLLTAFVWFFVAASLGLLLRVSLFYNLSFTFNYKFMLHAHSHVMFMGWLFNLLYIALVGTFINPAAAPRRYAALFYIFQVSVAGMLLAFPVQGYAAVSIAFSTLHVFADYLFAFRFFKDTENPNHSSNYALLFARWAVVFMVLSTIGPYGLGYAMANGLQNTAFYHLCIYFYLHFQYNGWLIFGITALVLHHLAQAGVALPALQMQWFLRLMVFSCVVSFSLSALFTHPPLWVYVAGLVSGSMQAVSILLTAPLIWQHRSRFGASGSITRWLFGLSALSFVLKALLQLASAFAPVADFAFQHRNIIIAYLHLVFLGVGTFFFLAYFAQNGLLSFKLPVVRCATFLLLGGFVITQTLLILQLYFSVEWLLALATAFLPASALLFTAAAAQSNTVYKTNQNG